MPTPVDSSFWTSPAAIAAFSVALVWGIAQMCRQWFRLPALPVALAVAALLGVVSLYGNEWQLSIGTILQVIFLTLTAAGVNVGVGALRRFTPGDDTTVASAEMLPRRQFWDIW